MSEDKKIEESSSEVEISKEDEEILLKALFSVSDEQINEDHFLFKPETWKHGSKWRFSNSPNDTSWRFTKPPSNKEVIPLGINEIYIGPSSIKKKHRLNVQADVIRQRLEIPNAVMLVFPGITYSAKSFWGVIWLYIYMKIFHYWAKKKYPSQKEYAQMNGWKTPCREK